MNSTVALGVGAGFLAGAALALLASYPIEENSIYVCFWALALALAAALAGAGAIVRHTVCTERMRVEHVVELTAKELLKRRGLESVGDR